MSTTSNYDFTASEYDTTPDEPPPVLRAFLVTTEIEGEQTVDMSGLLGERSKPLFIQAITEGAATNWNSPLHQWTWNASKEQAELELTSDLPGAFERLSLSLSLGYGAVSLRYSARHRARATGYDAPSGQVSTAERTQLLKVVTRAFNALQARVVLGALNQKLKEQLEQRNVRTQVETRFVAQRQSVQVRSFISKR